MRAELAIRGGNVLMPGGFRDGLDVAIGGGRIIALGAIEAADKDVDASGLYVLPGFVDVHVHGAGGSADPADMARFLPSTGVTAFLPTLAASSPDETLGFVTTVARVKTEPGAAEVLGSHLEGPYLSAKHCGAQPPEHRRAPNAAEVERLLDAAGGTLRRMTLAPELPGARETISLLMRAGVQVSLGHSACSYEQALEAVDWGASSVTHTYNAMAFFHHRAPALVGAALA
ncbi:MAG: N-acetylglucosamine-6-phosphate deacetylase, partial [Chloroflexota bacterium]